MSKANHSYVLDDIDNIKVPLPPLDACYWSNNDDSHKIRLLEFHYTLPLVVCADKDNQIFIWDYFMKMRVFHKSINDIYSNDIKPISDNNNNNITTIDNDNNLHGFSTYPIGRHLSSLANAKTNKDYIPSLFSTNENCLFNRLIGIDNNTITNFNMIDNNTNSNTKNNINLGELHRLMFANNSQSLFNRGKSFKNHHNTNSDTRVILVYDIGIIIYDYIKQKGYCISSNELTKPPTYAEFLYYDTIAIGCNDGVIRIFDISSYKHKEIKTITAHGKGSHIIAIKSLAITNVDDDNVRIRFLTVASDSKILLWETSMKDDMQELDGATPSAELMDTGSGGSPDPLINHSFVDTNTNILYTIHGDRSLRLWKMDELDNHSASSGRTRTNSHNKNNKKNRRSSLSAFLGATTTTTSSKVGISRIGKIKPLSSNSNDITKFSSCISLDDCPRYPSGTFMLCSKTDTITIAQISNEKSNDSDDANGKLRVLHEFSVFNMLVSYLHSMDISDNDIINMINIATQNHPQSIKVYKIAKHHHYNHLYALGTSIGLIVITLLPSNTPTVATSSMWSNNILTVEGTRINVKKITSSSSSSSADSNDITLTKTLTKNIETNTNIYNAITTCKPCYYVSPFNDYIAIHWPDSLFYIVYKVTINTNNDISDIMNVDQGYCLSFAWITNHHRYYNNDDDKEMYAILKPNYKLRVEKRRSSIIFTKSEMEIDSITDTDIVFKYLSSSSSSSSSSKSMEITNDLCKKYGITNIRELFGGSSLLCISSTKKNKKDKITNDSNIKGIKINDIYEDYNYYSRVAMKSKFYHIFMGYVNNNIELVVTPLGPVMSAVTSIVWDKSNSTATTSKGAIVIDNRINIVQITTTTNSSNDNNVSINFKTIYSIGIDAYPYATPYSLYWYQGCLFTSTSSSINVLYTEYDINANTKSNSNLKFAESFPIRQNFSVPINNSIFISDNDDDDKLPASYGCLELLWLEKGDLLLVSKTNSNVMMRIALSTSPIAFGSLMSSTYSEDEEKQKEAYKCFPRNMLNLLNQSLSSRSSSSRSSS